MPRVKGDSTRKGEFPPRPLGSTGPGGASRGLRAPRPPRRRPIGLQRALWVRRETERVWHLIEERKTMAVETASARATYVWYCTGRVVPLEQCFCAGYEKTARRGRVGVRQYRSGAFKPASLLPFRPTRRCPDCVAKARKDRR